jgi:hypothetical protein
MHSYIIGASGSGKTTYLLSELPERSFAFIDKHGQAARQIADSRPCMYWRPADLTYPVGFNPLEDVSRDHRWKVTADIVSVFSDIWKLGPETPRLLYYLRASVRLLLDTNGTTLLDIRRVLSDATYRQRLLRKSTDTETRQTWIEFEAKDKKQQATELASLQNKVAALADPLPLRYVLGQPTSTIDFEKLISRGIPLAVDLSDLGDEPAAILGAIIINAFKQAADRVGIPERPYRLYIDEFQNFGTSIISTILSESRKRGLFLTLAHQFISQLAQEIQDAVLGNCSTIVSFRVGADDAPIIGKAIDWHPQNLQDLGIGVARMRTIVRGKPTNAMLLETEVPDLATGHLGNNIAITATRYARARSKVEDILNKPAREKWTQRQRQAEPASAAEEF